MRWVTLVRPVVRRARKLRGVYGRGLVLLYHRVIEASEDPLELCVSPSNFSEQMQHIAKNFDPVPLGDLLATRSPRPLAVTFDDGYADNYWNAIPILREHNIPATIFVTSGYVGKKEPFWWDRLAAAILGDDPIGVFDMGARRLTWNRDESHEAMNAFWLVHTRLRRMPPAKIEEMLAELPERNWRSVDRALDREELVSAANEAGIRIGSHTVSHPLMTAIVKEAQETEIRESKRALENIIERPIESFAFPYGNREAISGRLLAMAKGSGFKQVCANIPGSVGNAGNGGLMRRNLVRDWDLGAFAENLSRLRDLYT